MKPPAPVGGSFRDPAARVYAGGERVLRGLDAAALGDFEALGATRFFADALAGGRVVGSRAADPADPAAAHILSHGWAGVIEHDRVPIVSYPYEWTFSMLRDAALLQLDLLEQALLEGWTLKDASPYNVQFTGCRPVFIDVPSFTRRVPGDYWRAYRPFCMSFLYPLMLTAYRRLPFQPLMRSSIDGIAPAEAARLFTGLDVFRKGVLSHVRFPAALEARAARRAADGATVEPPRAVRHSDAMIIGLVQSVRRIVQALPVHSRPSAWSDYAATHSYDAASLEEKKAFVTRAASLDRVGIAWDLGSNTGTFSELLGHVAEHVVSVDSDHESVERLYLRLREQGDRKVLPLVMDLGNPSPDQGWAGVERQSFERRSRPDLVLGLALIHHLCLGRNVTIPAFLDWLASTGARLILEFVDREDSMAMQMLGRKSEPHRDYNLSSFETELGRRYEILLSAPLKGGQRKLYYCRPTRAPARPPPWADRTDSE